MPKQITIKILLTSLAFFALSCEESLPQYAFPERVVAMKVGLVEQLSDRVAPPTRPMVRIQINGENIYDEVFLDSVDIHGTVRIWWKRKPQKYRTIYLGKKNLSDHNLIHNGKMQLFPGQKFSFEFLWDLRGDNGGSFIGDMDFTRGTQRVCAFNIECAEPEIFVIESSFTIYKQLGMITAQAKEFIYIGRQCYLCWDPPCYIRCSKSSQEHKTYGNLDK